MKKYPMGSKAEGQERKSEGNAKARPCPEER